MNTNQTYEQAMKNFFAEKAEAREIIKDGNIGLSPEKAMQNFRDFEAEFAERLANIAGIYDNIKAA